MTRVGDSGFLSPDIKFHLVRKIEIHKIIALNGTALMRHEETFLEFHKSAGVILFARNVESVSQLGELVGAVKDKLASGGLDPLIMADHEGDLVSVLRGVIGAPPSPMAIAAAGDYDLARAVARATGEMMRKLGVNTVLAPGADCCFDLASPITGLRSFGCRPDQVAEYAAQTIRGFHDAGVLTCTKHFPGHGSTRQDSHEMLPVIDRTIERLRSEDLVPFARAVEEGTDMVMAAHIALKTGSSADAGEPASFSKEMIQGLLRREMGFDGAVITDALEMAGARRHADDRYGGLAGGLERPLLAGADLLLYSRPVPEEVFFNQESMMSLRVMETIVHTLARIADKGDFEAKLEEAARESEGLRRLLAIFKQSEDRVNRLRAKATEYALPPRDQERRKVIELSDYPSMPPIYRTVAEKSIALVRDPHGFIPIDPGAVHTLVPVVHRPQGMIGGQDIDEFLEVLLKRFPAWKRTSEICGFKEDLEGIAQPAFDSAVRKGRIDRHTDLPPDSSRSIIVFSARGAPPHVFMAGLESFIGVYPIPLIMVTGWPLIEWVPPNTGVLVTFGAAMQTASAAAAILRGEAVAQGIVARVLPEGG
ncbi:MAG: glycoside hydrolase family 3 protein [Chitinivibrionia bacterium]|nr:glycoside hydrolase family 3 protein [Chitinivibrionia bacterium]